MHSRIFCWYHYNSRTGRKSISNFCSYHCPAVFTSIIRADTIRLFILPLRESVSRFSDQKFRAVRPDNQGFIALQENKYLRIYWKTQICPCSQQQISPLQKHMHKAALFFLFYTATMTVKSVFHVFSGRKGESHERQLEKNRQQQKHGSYRYRLQE